MSAPTTAPTTETEKVGFADFAEKLEEAKTSETEVVQTLPIDKEVKTTILVSVEDNVKKLLQKLASKEEIGWGIDTNPDDFSHLPNSLTGVVVHYITKGIKDDFGWEFEEQPKCLTYNMSKTDKKVAGKKRLLTRDQKNDLIAKTRMDYYTPKIDSGDMTIESAMFAIKDAYERVSNYKEMGYILPTAKTEYPYWEGETDEKKTEEVKTS